MSQLMIEKGLRRDCIEQFLIKCGKTKTNVMVLANHKINRESSEPIKTQRNLHFARETVRANHDWFWFYFWLAEKVAREFLTNHQTRIAFDAQAKTAASNSLFCVTKLVVQRFKKVWFVEL